jgi:putative ABC transport system permease protein
MPRQIDATDTLSAASPTLEIARLIGYLRPLTIAVTGLGLLLVAIAASGAAIGLMATMNARTRDLALLRALGASPGRIAMVAVAEASMIMAAALVLGGILAAGLLAIGGDILADETGLLLQPQLGWDQVALLLLGTISVTLLAAAFPALRAINTQIEELLQS